jgi:hypothetical protein
MLLDRYVLAVTWEPDRLLGYLCQHGATRLEHRHPKRSTQRCTLIARSLRENVRRDMGQHGATK